MTVLHHLQHQPRRNGQGGDQRNIDATSDHDDRHRQTENAEHRDTLQQCQHIRGAQKTGQGDREYHKKRGENRKHDSLLAKTQVLHANLSPTVASAPTPRWPQAPSLRALTHKAAPMKAFTPSMNVWIKTPRLRYFARLTDQSCSNGLISDAVSVTSAMAKAPLVTPSASTSATIFSIATSASTAICRSADGNDFASMKANTNQGRIASVRRM